MYVARASRRHAPMAGVQSTAFRPQRVFGGYILGSADNLPTGEAACLINPGSCIKKPGPNLLVGAAGLLAIGLVATHLLRKRSAKPNPGCACGS